MKEASSELIVKQETVNVKLYLLLIQPSVSTTLLLCACTPINQHVPSLLTHSTDINTTVLWSLTKLANFSPVFHGQPGVRLVD